MTDLQSEILGFILITIVVILLALFTKKMEDKYKF